MTDAQLDPRAATEPDQELEPPQQDPDRDAVGGVQDDGGEPPGGPGERVRPRAPEQIVAHALSITKGYGGYCLKFVRTCARIPGRYGSAKEAWAKAEHKHTDLADAPPGAFVFMSHPRSRYGHVAVYLGDRRMRTTNSTTGRLHSDPISTWERWGYTLQGWSEDLNGVRVPGLAPRRHEPAPKPKPKPKSTSSSVSSASSASTSSSADGVLRKGSRGSVVRALQTGLNRVFPAYSRLAVDGSYGPLTAGVVAEFQRRAGLPATGEVDARTRTTLARHGVRF